MIRFVAAVVALISITSTSAHAAGDAAKAQAIVNQACAACHGVDGDSPLPANPSLARQHPESLLNQLQEFKSATRANPVMAAMVANLSSDDMTGLARVPDLNSCSCLSRYSGCWPARLGFAGSGLS